MTKLFNSAKPKRDIHIRVEVGDALKLDADVLALKYAQALYGVDWAVHQRLSEVGSPPHLPKPGAFTLQRGDGLFGARSVLFVGVKSLDQFGYAEIRDFARRALLSLADKLPTTRHLAVTLHGPGFGLDETACFEAEVAGLVDAITGDDYPEELETISFVEQNFGRGNRLRAWLEKLLPQGTLPVEGRHSLGALEHGTQTTLRGAGYDSASKPHVFVAMPFAGEMDDVFHYGIQGAVNTAGMLCERADLSIFTGDVVDWVRRRIASATLVVADLSTANPNVYLEVGYAWGCRVPTVLLAKDASDLKFDVRSHRCLVYRSIKHLEELLQRELQKLAESSSSTSSHRGPNV
jgi:hypothetical protein